MKEFALWTTCFLLFGCSGNLKTYESERYHKGSEPRKIYIEDQVLSLNTRGRLTADKQFIVEIMTKDGVTRRGKLLDISDEALLIATGYKYAEVKAQMQTKQKKAVVNKTDILILKVW